MRFRYKEGATQITDPGTKLTDLPAGAINHRWTKNLLASRDGSRLYATVGSNSKAGENGLDKEQNRAAILEIDRATGKSRVFASGLTGFVNQNADALGRPVGVAVDKTGALLVSTMWAIRSGE